MSFNKSSALAPNYDSITADLKERFTIIDNICGYKAESTVTFYVISRACLNSVNTKNEDSSYYWGALLGCEKGLTGDQGPTERQIEVRFCSLAQYLNPPTIEFILEKREQVQNYKDAFLGKINK
jgi:hypothetical protein